MPISLTAYQRSVTDENGFRYTHTLRFYNAGDDENWDNLKEHEKEGIAVIMIRCGLLDANEKLDPQFPEPSCEELYLGRYILALADSSHRTERELCEHIPYERYKLCKEICK